MTIPQDDMYSKAIVEQLLEANKTLQEEVQRLTDSRRILRRVNSALREANDSLRRQTSIAIQNDDNFKALCQEGFDVPVSGDTQGGLPAVTPGEDLLN